MTSYIQSTEEYKGFILEIELTPTENPSRQHRRCHVYHDGSGIAICKTKKEAKDLIDHNSFAPFMKG